MSQVPIHSVAMVGVVAKNGLVLCICRKDNGHWEPPAGILERDETSRCGAGD